MKKAHRALVMFIQFFFVGIFMMELKVIGE